MAKYRFSDRVRYTFDKAMSKGFVATVGLLFLASLLFIAVIALVVVIFRLFPVDNNLDYGEAFWMSMLRTLDPGTMGGDQGVGFRIAMLVVTLGGLLLVASLIGIVSNAFDERVQELRKGRSRVLEQDHTVILGWSSKVVPIVQELVIANEDKKRDHIVIFSERDKVETEDELAHKVGNLRGTRLIVRSGDPMSLYDVDIASPKSARSIILLAPDDAEDPDNYVIRTALALVNNPDRKEGKYHIVGEIKDPKNLEAAKLVGGDEADWVLSQDLISRMTVQTSRQSGLSIVLTELLDFDGDEMYFTQQDDLVGKTYFDAQLSFATSAVIGIVRPDAVILNPAPNTKILETDQLVVVAEDNSTIELAPAGTPNEKALAKPRKIVPKPEHTLVLGYNKELDLLLPQLNSYVAKGSTVKVVADVAEISKSKHSNIAVTFTRGDTTSRALLESLKPDRFDHIIVLAETASLSIDQADARTLITLLNLRDIARKKGKLLNIVSEMVNDRNRQLAQSTEADDFIVSDKLISLMLAQLSENPRLAEVFDMLFSSSGSEIALLPIENYVALDTDLDFYTLVLAASRQGQTAFGYRRAALAHSAPDAYGVVVNPDKREKLAFAPGDKLIVLAEG